MGVWTWIAVIFIIISIILFMTVYGQTKQIKQCATDLSASKAWATDVLAKMPVITEELRACRGAGAAGVPGEGRADWGAGEGRAD